MPVILSIDAGADGYSAAIIRDGTVIAEFTRPQSRGAAEPMIPLIDQVLHASGLRLDQIDAIAAASGPGSFTGIRVALAAAHGLGAVKNIPTYGISAFAAMAAMIPHTARQNMWTMIALHSGKGDFYTAMFDADLKMVQPATTQKNIQRQSITIGRGVIAGSAALEASAAISDAAIYDLPSPLFLAAGAGVYLHKHWNDRAQFLPTPNYMRDADVTMAAG